MISFVVVLLGIRMNGNQNYGVTCFAVIIGTRIKESQDQAMSSFVFGIRKQKKAVQDMNIDFILYRHS